MGKKKIEVPEATFVMLIGIPGSGKSHLADIISSALGYSVHSSDAIRKELFGDENCQNSNVLVFKEMRERTLTDLKDRKSCIYDATNIKAKERKKIVNVVNDVQKIRKIAIICATKYEDCLSHNENRKRTIPEDVIEKMYKNFECPSYAEGWDRILISYNNTILFGHTEHTFFDEQPSQLSMKYCQDGYSEQDLENYIAELSKIPHDTPEHSETIGDHLTLAQKIFLESTLIGEYRGALSAREYDIVSMALLLHDIAKGKCKEWNEEKQTYVFYNHQNISAYESLFYTKAQGYCVEDIIEIATLIQYHMEQFTRNEFGIAHLKEWFGKHRTRLLEMVFECDKRAALPVREATE